MHIVHTNKKKQQTQTHKNKNQAMTQVSVSDMPVESPRLNDWRSNDKASVEEFERCLSFCFCLFLLVSAIFLFKTCVVDWIFESWFRCALDWIGLLIRLMIEYIDD